MNIKPVLLSAVAATLTLAAAQAALPKLAVKPKYRVCFNQSEMDNPWRLAQTKSMQDEAKRLGWTLVFTNANGSAAKQAADVRSCIAQRVDAIFLTPREEKPLTPVVLEAKRAGIPLFVIDRKVDEAVAKPGRDFVAFIGSDFYDEGRRAAEWLVKQTGGKAKIIELKGSTGSSPAIDREKGFGDYIKKYPGIKIIASQTGNFTRDEGRKVMETLIQAHPEATAVYAHNDEMALGAITALETAGRKPGKDITIVSIDGQRSALDAIIAGKLGATVECNPRFGVKAFQTLKDYAAGKQIAGRLVNEDRFFDITNAKQNLASAF
ncbi:ABC transporter substrate-binding protein [Deinococcus maricopensis]|uniref:Periplasmic binding protein/LacI transcriptional regulator n=1 Tax=Deinococcus maricopensis (strain DSM 21211 / LMG 22137 / NRRL B-23946 / LB-34) TaxID=709986 RepID=E8U479_DEIML|nr:ABC transporter substrate-binding protein [Deinococcus maricopensis]ADV65916.1 periplasmic binding protein/LacI transcriptional regulator [Deinococcus maricopensis DSM 21211]